MLDVNKDDLILLTVKYSQYEHIANRLLMEASKENIKLYIKNTRKIP
ncbi:hypothetical protein [Rickettsiella massiliensis]|nr:hypothetical protein [Rickettsiella massiliensis]